MLSLKIHGELMTLDSSLVLTPFSNLQDVQLYVQEIYYFSAAPPDLFAR